VDPDLHSLYAIRQELHAKLQVVEYIFDILACISIEWRDDARTLARRPKPQQQKVWASD